MLITKAPPAAPIVLNSAVLQLFMSATDPTKVCFLPIPGQSKLDMQLLNVTATGTVKANQPGTVQIGLFAWANVPNIAPPNGNSANWVMLGASPAEPIGGATDLVATSWMIRGQDLLFNLSSGKMQGTFLSNVADNPVAAADLTTNPNNLLANISPVVLFAIGARFTPTADDGHRPDVEMAGFTLTGES